MKEGITTRIHGNTKRLPHNALTYEDITRIAKFLSNYAEEQAIILPGRVPGYKKADFKLLPSSTSKKVHTSKTHSSESRGQGGSTLRRPLDECT